MSIVNVACGNCGYLLAVDEEQFHQPVPCPQCQQAIAPPPACVPAATPPPLPLAVPEEQESIFSSPEPDDEVLLGDAPPAPEIPAEPSVPHPSDVPLGAEVPASEAAGPLAAATSAAFVTAGSAISPEAAFEQSIKPDASAAAPAASPVPASIPGDDLAFLSAPAADTREPAAPEQILPDAAEPFPAVLPRRPVVSAMRGGLFIALVLVPLISWAILATLAVIVLLLRPQPPDPLERLPDVEGDYHGARHQRPVSYERVKPEAPLPRKLHVALGQALRIGDVEVRPQKVERRRIRLSHPGFPLEPAIDDSLVLYLRLRNVSADVAFCPTDPFFDRRWKGYSSSGEPYTFLELGQQRFYGGPLFWRPGIPPEERETVEGQKYKVLMPGDELATLVCTDPEDHVGQYLASYCGRLLWRVQVRRGLVRVRGREVSATAVVGVSFEAAAIQTPQPAEDRALLRLPNS